MNIVLGASGQIGSAVVDNLVKQKAATKGVVRNAKDAEELKSKGAVAAIADAMDLPALQSAFADGQTVFLLTPETGHSNDVLGDTRKILDNYRAAIEASPIRKVVGLSSMGAQCGKGSGNLEMSSMLEHAFSGIEVQQIFLRPAYYFSNWLPYLPTVKEKGILPTFYPVDLKIAMIAPQDVAVIVTDVMLKTVEGSPLYEIEGPAWYSSGDVAAAFGDALGRSVEARQLPEAEWPDALQKIGFTPDAIKNFILMTKLVISGDTRSEQQGTISLQTPTSLTQYLADKVGA